MGFVTKAVGRKLLAEAFVASAFGMGILIGAGVSNADSWSVRADSVCSDIYDSMGSSLHGEGADQNMVLFDYWHANVLSRTVRALRSIPQAPQQALEYIDGLDYLSQLEREDGAVSAKGGLSLELTREIRLVGSDLQSRAQALGVPACDAIVNYSENG